MSDTYKDGVQMERCLFCGSAIRLPSNEPVVNVSITDLQNALALLHQQHASAEWVHRLHQAVGHSIAQIQAQARAAESEAIPDSVKTDRGGLPLEEA